MKHGDDRRAKADMKLTPAAAAGRAHFMQCPLVMSLPRTHRRFLACSLLPSSRMRAVEVEPSRS
jgi:hypothetical protein